MYRNQTENHYPITKPYPEFYQKNKPKTLQPHALTKFDINKDYNKGFYLAGGLRNTFVLNAKSNAVDVKDFYKSSNFGAMLGFGVAFSKVTSIELLFEKNITNTLNVENNLTQNYGFYANLLINLEPSINK